MRYFYRIPSSIHQTIVLIVLSLGLIGCTGGQDIDGNDIDGNDSARRGVIIEFRNESAAFKDLIRPLVDDAAFASVRTYNNLPIIAVNLDGEMMFRVLQLPEVISIRPDRQIGTATDGFTGGPTMSPSQAPASN